jgi:hypothetical protein
MIQIIQIRGTSGSGKTWVARQMIDRVGEWNSVMVPGRKKPLFMTSCSDWPPITVFGHYESPCGGCDTIGSARAVFDMLVERWPLVSTLNHRAAVYPTTILMEGLLLSEDVKWTAEMARLHYEVKVLFLTTPLDKCLLQIGSRRASVGNEKEVDPTNTTNRVRTIERARRKLVESGVSCLRCSPNQAPDLITKLVQLHADEGN